MTSTALALPTAKTDAARELTKPDRLETFKLAMPAERRGDWESLLATYIIGANELTKPCTPISVAKSVYNGVRLGLACGAPLNHAFLVPFWNKHKNANECQLIPGYEGLLELALGSGHIVNVSPQLVLAGEEFRHWVDRNGEQVHHEIPNDRAAPTADNVNLAYCVWQTVNGGAGVKVVQTGELRELAKRWKDNKTPAPFAAMALKTPIRRASKLWKKTRFLAEAVYLDEQAERGEPQDAPNFDSETTPEHTYSLNDLSDDEQRDIEESARRLAEANSH